MQTHTAPPSLAVDHSAASPVTHGVLTGSQKARHVPAVHHPRPRSQNGLASAEQDDPTGAQKLAGCGGDRKQLLSSVSGTPVGSLGPVAHPTSNIATTASAPAMTGA
jgi:hypothetical protein